MKNAIKAEFYKLWHLKSFWTLAAVSLALGNILILDRDRPKSVQELIDGFLYGTPFLYFLLIILGALFIGTEFENRTFTGNVASGQKRGAIVFAKILTFLTACVVILLGPVLVDTAVGLAVFGTEGMSLSVYLARLSILIWITLAMGMVPCLAAFLFKDVGKTLIVPLVVYFVMIFFLNSRQWHLFALVFPMGQLRLLSQHSMGDVWTCIGADLVWAVGCYAGAHLVFCRSDLK